MEVNSAYREVRDSLVKVERIFAMQERQAICRQELAEVEVEMAHYKQEQPDKFSNKEVKISCHEKKWFIKCPGTKFFTYSKNTYDHHKTWFVLD